MVIRQRVLRELEQGAFHPKEAQVFAELFAVFEQDDAVKELVRFYQIRCGVHAVISTKRELTFFLVVYLFTIQPESGNAPIEKIIPEAKDMPLYSLLNDPFACGVTPLLPHVKPLEEMATVSMKRVA